MRGSLMILKPSALSLAVNSSTFALFPTLNAMWINPVRFSVLVRTKLFCGIMIAVIGLRAEIFYKKLPRTLQIVYVKCNMFNFHDLPSATVSSAVFAAVIVFAVLIAVIISSATSLTRHRAQSKQHYRRQHPD